MPSENGVSFRRVANYQAPCIYAQHLRQAVHVTSFIRQSIPPSDHRANCIAIGRTCPGRSGLAFLGVRDQTTASQAVAADINDPRSDSNAQ